MDVLNVNTSLEICLYHTYDDKVPKIDFSLNNFWLIMLIISVSDLTIIYYKKLKIDKIKHFSNLIKIGVRPAGIGKQDHILPKHLCQRLFNIYVLFF